MLRVLYLNSSGQVGGAESSLLTLMEGLRRLQPEWSLSLLLGEDGPLAARTTKLGVTVQVLPFDHELGRLGSGMRFGLGSVRRTGSLLLAFLRYRSRIKAAIHGIRPDIIHANGLKMHILLASITRQGAGIGRVRVCHVHDYVSRRPMTRWLLRAASKRYDRVVTNSNSVSADLRSIRIPPGKLNTIHNGVSMQRFSPAGSSLDLDRLSNLPPVPADVIRVGLVATFGRWKGHTTFLRALALLSPGLKIHAYVIGGPIYQTSGSQYSFDELRSAAEKYCPGVEVGFTGIVDDIAAAYRSLDIVVHASTEPEPFGMVIIEAMACQRAVIVSRGGGACEIFEEEVTALSHPPGDAEMLARRIERLAADAGLRLRLGENGRATVAARFEAGAMAARFAELYATLAAARQASIHARPRGVENCFA